MHKYICSKKQGNLTKQTKLKHPKQRQSPTRNWDGPNLVTRNQSNLNSSTQNRGSPNLTRDQAPETVAVQTLPEAQVPEIEAVQTKAPEIETVQTLPETQASETEVVQA